MKLTSNLIAKLFLAALVSIVCVGVQAAETKAATAASAGWAEVDITPPLGIALGGRGAPATASKKVLDPLVASAVT